MEPIRLSLKLKQCFLASLLSQILIVFRLFKIKSAILLVLSA